MKRSLLLVLTAFLLLAAPVTAQDNPQTREGFFIGFGLGWGSLGCDDCGDEREGGLSGFFKLGGAINEKILLGFETNGWTKEEEGVRLSHANGSFVAYLYPSPESGFFLKGGVGIARLDLDLGGWGSAAESGVGVVAGLGFDSRLGADFSLTPFVNILYGSFDGGSTNVLQAGLGVTWH